MKPLLRTVHLWTGLVFGTILVLQGLTGAALSWVHELDALLNPGLLHVAPPPAMRAGEPLRVQAADAQAVHDLLASDRRYGKPSMLMLPERAGDVYVAWYRPGKPSSGWEQAVTRQVMVDPATLAVLGERNWGEAGLSRPLLMPTLFHFHRYLLAGETGKVVIAVQGVALVLMTLTGIVIWWPRMTRSAIANALSVRFGGNWPRFSFQLHRSSGALCAPVLLFLGFSGVHFNIPTWTTPLVGTVAPVTPNVKPVNLSEAGLAPLSLAGAMAAAQARFPEARIGRVNFPAGANQPWEVRVRQPGELRQGPGATRISIDARDGRILRVADPLRGPGGDRFLAALFPLHSGEAFGVAGKVFISFMGITPLAFFVTGIVVWLKFRRKPKKKPKASKPAVKREGAPA
ncbi:PepSY-associated TM helix domain-containing protein [Massilia sp. SYSU DXS3249]